ncbi:MAG: HEAT repeat domain-containing protein [Elusimicrobia bacterium]|nr:HEAT repeat domain-containing protein [Elusimicrobiota bacterium]
MSSWTLVAVACLALAAPARAAVELAGLEVYGTTRLTDQQAQARYGNAVAQLVRLKARDTPNSRRAFDHAARRVENDLVEKYGFVFARLSWSDFFADGKHKAFLDIDVVEPADRAARMPFKAAARKSTPDPAGLLAHWTQYNDLGWRLFKSGELSINHNCLAAYCEWGTETLALKTYEEKFVSVAKDHKEALQKVVRLDKDPLKRASAVYLLAYLPDIQESAKLIEDGLDDPDPEVRTAALKVYAEYAANHKEVSLPREKIAAALDYPTAADRSRAIAVVAGMASNPLYRRFLIAKAGSQMLRLMQSKEPSLSDTAYAAIGILSGETFKRENIAAWQSWLTQARAHPEAPPAESPRR